MIFSLTGTNTKKKKNSRDKLATFFWRCFYVDTCYIISLFLKNKNAVIVRQSFVHSFMQTFWLNTYCWGLSSRNIHCCDLTRTNNFNDSLKHQIKCICNNLFKIATQNVSTFLTQISHAIFCLFLCDFVVLKMQYSNVYVSIFFCANSGISVAPIFFFLIFDAQAIS